MEALKHCCKQWAQEKKVIVKFPGTIERPVEGHECELTIVSIFLCDFHTSA